ncbi:MAG: 4'-phosphopantetheinyl transferase family protein [Muribaculaceae bacterium]
MPLLKNQYFFGNITLLRWKLTESWQELLGLCSAKGIKIDCESLPKSDKRRCEMLAERLLLSHYFMGIRVELGHDEHGAPRIVGFDDIYVSISHTHGMVIMALSEHEPMGIDVECISERVVKVRDRFINDSENAGISRVDATDLTLVWTAKEAMYKLAGVPGASLRDDFTIRSTVFTGASNEHSLRAHTTAAGTQQDIELCSIIDREEAMVTTVAVFYRTPSERLDRR